MTDAQNWYTSSEYNNISHDYIDNGIDLALVDGVSPDFTMAGFAEERRLSPTLKRKAERRFRRDSAGRNADARRSM